MTKTHFEIPHNLAMFARRQHFAPQLRAAPNFISFFEETLRELVHGPLFTGWHLDVSALVLTAMEVVLERAGWRFDQVEWEPFYEAINAAAAKGKLLPSLTVGMVSFYHALNHNRTGRRVYTVSPALAEQLHHTELRGLSCEDLRLPYECVYIQNPTASDMRLHIGTENYTMHGLYISEETATGHVGARWWRVLFVGDEDNVGQFWVLLTDGHSVESALDELDKANDSSGNRLGAMGQKWRPIFTWAMNVVLYSTWSNPGERIMANPDARKLWDRIQKLPPKTPKRRALLDQFKRLDPQHRILLGKDVRVQRGAPEQAPSLGGGTGHKQWVRTRVSGHWRNQPHGVGRLERKLIFIEPFWRGDEDAPISAPKHVVV